MLSTPIGAMVELIRTTNPVFLSWIEMILRERGIKFVVFDLHTSIAYGGALDAVPRRIMVHEDDVSMARRVLQEAGEGDEHG